MRSALCSVVLCLLGTVPAWGEAVPAQPLKPPIYLSGAADLDRLRAANPDHYARAERILAAADRLCRPGRGEIQFAVFNVRDLQCSRMLLKTSNPPKFQLSFRLDETRYIATVTVTDSPPRLVHADDRSSEDHR